MMSNHKRLMNQHEPKQTPKVMFRGHWSKAFKDSVKIEYTDPRTLAL